MNDPRHPTPGQPQYPQHPSPGAPAPQLRPQQVIPHAAPQARPGIAPMPVQSMKSAPTELDLDPIELVDDALEEVTAIPASAIANNVGMPPAPIKSKIKAFGPESTRKEHAWKRTPHTDGKGAIRVKTFHGKYSDQGMEHIDDVINEWLDNHPEVEVKFVTSTVNVFEGKIRGRSV